MAEAGIEPVTSRFSVVLRHENTGHAGQRVGMNSLQIVAIVAVAAISTASALLRPRRPSVDLAARGEGSYRPRFGVLSCGLGGRRRRCRASARTGYASAGLVSAGEASGGLGIATTISGPAVMSSCPSLVASPPAQAPSCDKSLNQRPRCQSGARDGLQGKRRRGRPSQGTGRISRVVIVKKGSCCSKTTGNGCSRS